MTSHQPALSTQKDQIEGLIASWIRYPNMHCDEHSEKTELREML